MPDIFDAIAPDTESASSPTPAGDVFDQIDPDQPRDIFDTLDVKPEQAPWQKLKQEGLKGIGSLVKGASAATHMMAPVPVTGPGVSLPPQAQKSVDEAMDDWRNKSAADRLKEIQEDPTYVYGQALEDVAPEVHPVTPAQEKGAVTKVGGMAGGFLPLVASGPAAPVTIGLQSMGDHISQDYENAKKSGLDDDAAAEQALKKATASGALQTSIFLALPKPIRSVLEKYLVNKIGQGVLSRWLAGRVSAATEGAVMGGTSRAGENAVEGEPLTKDIGSSAAGLGAANLLLPWLREKPETSEAVPASSQEPPPESGTGENRPEAPQPDKPAPVGQDLVEALVAEMQKNQIKSDRPAPQPGETVEVEKPAEPKNEDDLDYGPGNRHGESLDELQAQMEAETGMNAEDDPAKPDAFEKWRAEQAIVADQQRKAAEEKARIEANKESRRRALDQSDEDSYTVLDAVSDHGGLGGPDFDHALRQMEDGRTPAKIAADYGGEYDALADVLEQIRVAAKEKNRKRLNTLREAYRKAGFGGGHKGVDTTLEGIRASADEGQGYGSVPRDTGELIDHAWRAANGEQGDLSPTELFWRAVDDPKSTIGLERINVQQLNVGDTFRIRAPGVSHEELVVKHIDPDSGEVQVKDGPKIGVQNLPDGMEIWVKKGSLQVAGEDHLAEEPPRYKLDQPESVTEQKERLAREEQKRKANAQRDEIERRQSERLSGTRGDIGQRDMFGGGDLLSESPGDPSLWHISDEELLNRIEHAPRETARDRERLEVMEREAKERGLIDSTRSDDEAAAKHEAEEKGRQEVQEERAEQDRADDERATEGEPGQPEQDDLSGREQPPGEHVGDDDANGGPQEKPEHQPAKPAGKLQRSASASARDQLEPLPADSPITEKQRFALIEAFRRMVDRSLREIDELSEFRRQSGKKARYDARIAYEQAKGMSYQQVIEALRNADFDNIRDMAKHWRLDKEEYDRANHYKYAQTNKEWQNRRERGIEGRRDALDEIQGVLKEAQSLHELPADKTGQLDLFTPTEDKPGLLGQVESWLDRAIEKTRPGVDWTGETSLGLLKLPVWLSKEAAHGALKVARAALRRGLQLADAMTQAIEWVRHYYPEKFNEEELRKWLYDSFTQHAGEEAPTVVARLVRDLPEYSQKLFNWANTMRRKVGAMVASMPIREVISYLKDKADNTAVVFGKRTANVVLHTMNRVFGDPIDTRNKLREDALTFVIESGAAGEGKPGQQGLFGEHIGVRSLQNMRERIVEAGRANSIWGRRALQAIAYAEEHYDLLKPIAELYQKLTDAQNASENAAGIDTLYRKGGYVFHTQDVNEHWDFPDVSGGTGGGAPAPFRHIRDHATYADSIAAGLSPKSLSAVDLMQRRMTLGRRLINYGAWVDSVSRLIDPTTRLPVVTQPEVRIRADGSTDTRAPAGYALQDFAGQKVAVHKGYTGLIADLTDESWMRKGALREGLMKLAGTSKHAVLLFDTFHLGRLAFWNAVSRTGSPTFRRGLTLLDSSVEDLQKMLDRGEIPAEWGRGLIESKRKLDALLDAGMNVGNVGDNLYTDWIQKLPVAGRFNKWLFESYQRGAMSEVGLIEWDRWKKARPELRDDQVARLVARDVNTRFGNLNSQSWIKSKTGQDLARLLFLAPQWNESLIRAELGAISQASGAAVDLAKGRVPPQMLARSVATAVLGTFVANQLINYATRGKPTWENEEESAGAKISAYIPDAAGGPGFFLNPMAVPAEITHLLWSATSRSGDFTKALHDFAVGRLNSLSRPLYTFITRKDVLGRSLRSSGDVYRAMLSEAVPAPISGGAIYRFAKQQFTGQHEEAFPGQYQKQAMQTFGIKTDSAPSPEQRMRALATSFNRRSPDYKPNPEFYGGDYDELKKALRLENARDAAAALDDLRKKKSEAQINKYMRNFVHHPFTGSLKQERNFKPTLNAEQSEAYDRAIGDRRKIQERFKQLQADHPAGAVVEDLDSGN